jgi:hypothetical protein
MPQAVFASVIFQVGLCGFFGWGQPHSVYHHTGLFIEMGVSLFGWAGLEP